MLKRHQAFVGATAFGTAILAAFAHAQVGRGGSAWLTAHGDAQRTSWIRSDALISVAAMSKPGFELQWKTPLENENRGSYGLGSGVSAPGVTLFVPMSLVGGSSNNVYAIDSDTGYLVWQRHFDAPLPPATDACPGGTTASPTRIVTLEPPAASAAAAPGGGRNTQGYHTVLGQPGEGAPVEVRGGGPGRAGAPPAAARGPGAPAAAAGAPPAGSVPAGGGQRADAPAAGRGGQGGGGFGRGPADPIPGAPAEQLAGGGGLGRPSGVVYVISSDGMLHVMGLQSGKDLQRPAPFVPPNSRWSDPIAVGTRLYTSTSAGCGGAPNAVWAIDLESESKPVVSWKSDGPIVGPLAFTSDGRVAVAVSSPSPYDRRSKSFGIVTLDPSTLTVKSAYATAEGDAFVAGPTIFKHGDREVIAAPLKNGRGSGHILLVDAAVPTAAAQGPSAIDITTPIATDSLATWEDASAQWLLVPIDRGVTASRVEQPMKSPLWTAGNLSSPATPIIVNRVVFVLDRGNTAVLHAYEGTTGKELWTSGKTMTAAAAPGSFWSAFGQVYVGTTDGTLYAFGFNDERR